LARLGSGSIERVGEDGPHIPTWHVPVTGATARPLPAIVPGLRPRPRWRELQLLGLVAVALFVGSVSLGATVRARAAAAADAPLPDGALAPHDLTALLVYLGVLLAAHVIQVMAGRRTDQVLLPAVGLLGGLSLLLMQRLPQSLAGQLGGLAQTQLVWLVLAFAVITLLAVGVRSDSWLRLYKYTWAAVGVGLLVLTFAFGRDVNGARLTLDLGPISGQPSELLKVILVVFLAGYLSEFRPLLVEQSTRLGPLRLPPLPYLAPMVAMWAIALGIVVIQRDLGAALLFFAVFLTLLYVATARASYVVIGLGLFVAGSAVMYRLFGHVAQRVDIWLDPFVDPQGAGYQVVQALYAFGRGGILGTGLGNGLPTVGGRLPIPEIHTDFPLAALGEELGLIGVLAILGLYLVVIERGLRIAASAADDFRALLAAGLSLVVGVQAFIIAAGNLKLIPLTGITLPFISYGGSSLLANALVVGLLLALSDRAVEPPPPRPPRSRLARIVDRGAR
jgi:cell division protein FtsW (lipid II flippase)